MRVKQALFQKRIVDVACGAYHTLVLTDKGELYAFGLGDKGQLGLGNAVKHKNAPAILRGQLEKEYIFKIAAGGRHNLAATNYLPIITVEQGTLSSDFDKIVNSKDFSDVDLKLKKVSIKGHKVMLARSSVFNELMQAMKEGQRILKFGDVRPDVLLCVIRYLYTDNVLLKPDPQYSEGKKSEEDLISEFAIALQEVAENCGIPLSKADAASPETMFPHTLVPSLAQFVNNPLFADIKFRTPEGDEIYAHKAILSSRSDRWRAMFLAGFVESRQDVIDTPIRAPVFLSLLKFVYTDELDVNPEDSVELLMASNEFGLPRLKQLCEEFVERGIDVDNVAWLFEIADQNDCHQLKKFTFYFLLKEFDEVCKTETYANLTPQTLEQISLLRKPKDNKPTAQEGKNCTLQ
eukprot:TRINITY_DN5728_c0_g1_i1.p1 TRINITY_DN5728_c0_g1~~TRINITY_DN5728_c0_g1_i1.p1  ORF type:complete len:406 (+),score=118.67 TRINITY_DN5728_c0_g1_i1:1006-2223(+)